jgi:threonine aldolase
MSSHDTPIDLRSDTVTRPTAAMRAAIAQAEVGDDVLGDDPTVIRLQETIASILGKEAACFVPTGTMANQCAIRAQTEPGDEVIAHEDSHIIHYETGSPAALSGVMIRPLRGERGLFEAADVEAAIRAESIHAPRSRLLIVENTHNRGGGAVWPLDRCEAVARAARERGLRTHMDGARIWNACAATGLDPARYARHFDTVSCCFSKGLGAPAGSAVAGDAATIARVHRFRKMFGGTMRQSGVLAAAALHALSHHRARLVDDHSNASRLAARLAEVDGLTVEPVETNIVFVTIDRAVGVDAAGLCARLRGVGVLALPNAPLRVRMVTHLDVNAAMIDRAAGLVAEAIDRTRAAVRG